MSELVQDSKSRIDAWIGRCLTVIALFSSISILIIRCKHNYLQTNKEKKSSGFLYQALRLWTTMSYIIITIQCLLMFMDEFPELCNYTAWMLRFIVSITITMKTFCLIARLHYCFSTDIKFPNMHTINMYLSVDSDLP